MPFSPLRLAIALSSTLLMLSAMMAQGQNSTPKPQIIHTVYTTSDYVVAQEIATAAPFHAPIDGVHDAAPALQSAIDAMAAAGGGVVFLPAGRYLCNGNLVLHEGVTLRGDWKAPDEAAGSYAVAGTVLMPTAGRGQADGASFISMARGSGVRDLSIWYPDQKADSITPYPWTIAMDPAHAGNNFTIEQVTLVNAYDGMRFGPEYNEMFTVRQVYGAPLHVGFTADSVTDIGRLIDLRFSPRYWAQSGLKNAPSEAALTTYLQSNAIGIDMLRSDWQYIYDVDIEGYGTGLQFDKGLHGSTLGVLYGVHVAGGKIGLLVNDVSRGLELTRCRLEGSTAGVVTPETFDADLQFNDCTLSSDTHNALLMQGSGSVRLQNCELSAPAGRSAIDAQAGSLNLLTTRFPGTGRQIDLAAGVTRALLVGCTFGGPVSNAIHNDSRGAVQIDSNPLVTQKPTEMPMAMPPDRRPATNRLFNVLDYGATSTSTTGASFPGTASMVDDTAAFQKALNAASAAGGGTVFVPAGYYLFKGTLTVPTGVELRGCFDVPHHTISLGSVLLPTAGRGDAHGTPFISLQTNSGARGLTIWYPDQVAESITAYPWTFRSLGPNCWLIDDTSANSYDLADFGTYPSSGHLLRYVAGSPLRTGILVSNGSGVVDSCHFNAHEWARRTDEAPPLTMQAGFDAGNAIIDYQQQHLNAFVFGDCAKEIQANNFVYGCANGLTLTSFGGHGCGGWIINHASDGSSTGVKIDAASPDGCQIINTEVATVGSYKHTALEMDKSCAGKVEIYGGISFGQTDVPTMLLQGSGQTLIEGWYSSQQAIHVANGGMALQDCLLSQPLPRTIEVDAPFRHLDLIGNSAGPDAFTFPASENIVARGNGEAVPITPLVARFEWPAKGGDDPPTITRISADGVTDPSCQVEPNQGRDGEPALVLSGTPVDGKHAIEYYSVFNTNLKVQPGTVLRYWIKPATASAVRSGVDLTFSDGSNLRDEGLVDSYGRGMHPGSPRGFPGLWTRVECPIGAKLAGKTITKIVFAFDAGDTVPAFRSVATDIEIGEPAAVEHH